MQLQSLPSLRRRLFYIFVVIGSTAACLLACTISIIDVMKTRGFLMQDIDQQTRLISIMISALLKDNAKIDFNQIVLSFPDFPGFRVMCIYNKDNQLILHGQKEEYNGCPRMVRTLGLRETLFFIYDAVPVKEGDLYLGTVYVEGPILSLKPALYKISAIFTFLLMLSFTVCAIAAHYGARHINHLMDDIRRQIDCLKENAGECLLMPSLATRETMTLFDAIRSLRIHLETLLVPKENVLHIREWYENIFFNLSALMRRRIPADSSLIPLLSDCELLLRLNNPDEPPPLTAVTDIQRLVDESLASARLLNPPGNNVHLIASLKPAAVREWKIKTTYLSALLRHLLLIGLARTHKGLICLRLEIEMPSGRKDGAMLEWKLEDTGPPLQQGVLHANLIDTPYKLISVSEASWLLVVQLTKCLEGYLEAENSSTGLVLRGKIPLEYEQQSSTVETQIQDLTVPTSCHHRLALMVGDDSNESLALCNTFEGINYVVFWTDNPIQALELAPVLPVSIIVLNASLLNDNGHAIDRRLLRLMENKLMPVVPLWVLTAFEAPLQHNEWMQKGINQVLLTPVKREKLNSLCQGLKPYDSWFWSLRDMQLMQEFPEKIQEHFLEMLTDLLAQIERVRFAITNPPSKVFALEIIYDVHAVRSASLAMGYMRLAALMANLEHILADKQTALSLRNIAIIASCLENIKLQ